MTALPRLAWHELLRPIAPPAPPDPSVFVKGKEVHAKLEAIIGEKHLVEQEFTYREPDLPFEIAYHPDVLRQEISASGPMVTFVYEIKPLIWFLRNRTYCEAQINGYWHFTGALDASFVLYWQPDRDSGQIMLSVLPARRVPWDELRKVTMKAYSAMVRA